MTLARSTGPIQLHHGDTGQIVVTPQDQDRFVMAVQQAVSACQAQVAAHLFLSRFQGEFLTHLFRWCENHQDAVASCYVPFPPQGCMKVFIIARASTFDLDLSDRIAALELDLEELGWPCDILQITAASPPEIETFFDPGESIQVFAHGNRSTTPREG